MIVHIQFKEKSGMLAFGEGRITNEMVEETPQDSKLIPVDPGHPVIIDTEHQGVELSDLWFICHQQDGVLSSLITMEHPIDAMIQSGISMQNVISFDHILVSDITSGTPFYVSI